MDCERHAEGARPDALDRCFPQPSERARKLARRSLLSTAKRACEEAGPTLSLRTTSERVDHLPEGRTTPVSAKGAGALASGWRRDRVQRLLDALVPGQR